jgi:structure-specific recognition protein 1
MATETWNNITERDCQKRGKFSLGSAGLSWSGPAEESVNIPLEKLKASKISWLNARPRCSLLVVTSEGENRRFHGFRAGDYERVKGLCPAETKENLENVAEPAISGKQFGHLSCENKIINFAVDDKIAFEMPGRVVSQCVYKAPNNLELQIYEADPQEVDKDDCELVQVSFYVPMENLEENDEEEGANDETGTWGSKLQAQILKTAAIDSATGDMITQFTDDVGTFKAPRGRYAIEMYESFLRLYGSTYNEKIKYEEISALFLLNHPDNREHSLVISLREDKKVIQGNQRYQHLVMTIKAGKELTAEIYLSEKDCLEKYGTDKTGQPALKPRMTGDMHTLVATIFKIVSRKKVYISTPHYKNYRGGDAVHTTLKAHSGLLFPLQRALLFIHRPTIFIKYGDIRSVEFERYTGPTGASHTFDVRVRCKSVGGELARDYHFTGIGRDEYPSLLAFLDSKKIRIDGPRFDVGGTRSGRRGAGVNTQKLDIGSSSEDEAGSNSSEDEDFDAGEFSSDGGEPTDDSEEENEEDEASEPEKKKSPGKPSRKRKAGKPKKERKKKAKKDPNAPKRPQSSYFLFMATKRDGVKSANPGMSIGEISKNIGNLWKQLPDVEKKVFEEQYAVSKAKYDEEYKAYVQSDAYKKFIAENPPEARKKKKKAEKEASPYPPKPTKKSSWLFFNNDKRKILQKEHPEARIGELTKMASALWKGISPEEKKKYDDMAGEEKRKYDIAIVKWREEKSAIHEQRLLDGLTSNDDSSLSETSESESSDDSGDD